MEKQELQIMIGANIVKIRQGKGLKQYELADKINIEDSALRRIEKGRTNVSIWMLYRIAEALSVPVSELLRM
ncbi:MAG: helix-turn-helix domain-containing protein [bacterium]